MRLPIQFGMPALLCGVVLAQSQPDVTGILKKVGAAYKAVSQYELITDTTQTDPVSGKRETTHMLIALKIPDRYRMEGVPGGNGGGRKTSKVMIVVLDGTTIWFYDPEGNQYASYPASIIGTDLPDELEVSGIDYFAMSRYRKAADFAATAKYLREEEIEIGGEKVPCSVVSVREGAGAGRVEYTWWVDKKSDHIVREDFGGSSMIFNTIKLDEPLPDSLFKFDVPPGARKNGGDRPVVP